MLVYKLEHNNSIIEFSSVESAEEYSTLHSLGAQIEEEERIAPEQYIKPVTPRQMRQALLVWNLLSTVEGAINSMAEPAKSSAKVEWEYSLEFQRSHPLVNQMGAALGMTSVQLDALWALAATL